MLGASSGPTARWSASASLGVGLGGSAVVEHVLVACEQVLVGPAVAFGTALVGDLDQDPAGFPSEGGGDRVVVLVDHVAAAFSGGDKMPVWRRWAMTTAAASSTVPVPLESRCSSGASGGS
jgi:hypothetical protein